MGFLKTHTLFHVIYYYENEKIHLTTEISNIVDL